MFKEFKEELKVGGNKIILQTLFLYIFTFTSSSMSLEKYYNLAKKVRINYSDLLKTSYFR